MDHVQSAGLFSTMTAASVAGVTRRQAHYWAETGLVVPERRAAGAHDSHGYALHDVIALSAVAELRRRRISLQRCRRVQSQLQGYGKSFSNAVLAIVASTDGPADVVLLDAGALVSLIDSPKQVITALPVERIERETRERLQQATQAAADQRESRAKEPRRKAGTG